MLVHMPLEQSEPRRISGRSAWIIGQPTAIELWEGGPNTPWAVEGESSAFQLHHTCYWSDDLDASAAKLEAIGFARELTPVHDDSGLLGFCYLRNAGGARIEIQSSADKSAVYSWIARGTPKHLSWLRRTK